MNAIDKIISLFASNGVIHVDTRLIADQEELQFKCNSVEFDGAVVDDYTVVLSEKSHTLYKNGTPVFVTKDAVKFTVELEVILPSLLDPVSKLKKLVDAYALQLTDELMTCHELAEVDFDVSFTSITNNIVDGNKKLLGVVKTYIKYNRVDGVRIEVVKSSVKDSNTITKTFLYRDQALGYHKQFIDELMGRQ